MSDFPKFLHQEFAADHRKLFGARLAQERGSRSIADVAAAARVQESVIKMIESGDLSLSVGSLYEIADRGYKKALPVILSGFYKEIQPIFDPEGTRPFERDFYYSFRRKKRTDKPRFTPMLIGGDLRHYAWGIPLRNLKGQAMVTDLLELAPYRKNELKHGKFPEHQHIGIEIICVIFGTVTVNMRAHRRSPFPPIVLAAESFVHLNSSHPHFIENTDPNSNALLYVVRTN